MGPIMEIARAKNIPVIEDCAQTHAAKYKGRYAGTWGTIGAFSTMYGKHHATGGQGGVVFTKSKELYQKVRWYSDRGKPFGIPGATSNVVCSLNLNLNDLSACIGRVQLKKLPGIVAKRRRIAQTVAKKFLGLKSARIVLGPKDTEASYWFLIVALDLSKLTVDKDTFVKALVAEGVVADYTYAHLFTRWDWYKKRAVFGTSGLPWTSSRYKGDPDRKYPTPNLDATDKCQFQLYMHESYPPATLAKVFAAFKKVEEAYLR